MEVFPAAAGLITRALVVSARWAGRARRLALEQATAAADANREAALEARVMVVEDMVEQRDAHIAVLQGRLGEERFRKPYPLMERLRIIWCQSASKTDPPLAANIDPPGIGEISSRLPLSALQRPSAIAVGGSSADADFAQMWVSSARRPTSEGWIT